MTPEIALKKKTAVMMMTTTLKLRLKAASHISVLARTRVQAPTKFHTNKQIFKKL